MTTGVMTESEEATRIDKKASPSDKNTASIGHGDKFQIDSVVSFGPEKKE